VCVRTSPDKGGTVGGPPDNSPTNRAIMAALHPSVAGFYACV